MSFIYLPVDNVNSYKCYEIRDKDTIRAYVSEPRINSNSNYTDFFINSNYLKKDGVISWSQYSTLPICVSQSEITNNFIYRNDFPNVLLMVFIMLVCCYYFPFRIFSRLFGRWLKW